MGWGAPLTNMLCHLLGYKMEGEREVMSLP